MKPESFLAVVTSVAILCLGGCSKKATVSGTVSVNGKPLKHGGAVAFHPVDSGPTAVGQIDSSGRYSVAVGGDPQIAPGSYKVTVVGYAERRQPENTKDAPPAPALVTSLKFRDPETTPLLKDLQPGGNNIDIDVDQADKER